MKEELQDELEFVLEKNTLIMFDMCQNNRATLVYNNYSEKTWKNQLSLIYAFNSVLLI